MKDSNSGHAQSVSEVQTMPPRAQVIQMSGGHVVARAIYALAEIGIADHLKEGPRSADELAQATDTHSPSLYRLLRSMAGFGMNISSIYGAKQPCALINRAEHRHPTLAVRIHDEGHSIRASG